MKGKKAAFVFAHPAAHEIIVAGLVQKYDSHLLFLTQSDSGDVGSSDLARRCLEQLEICQSITFLEMSEIESYTRAFAADFEFYREYRNRVLDWLCKIQPDVVVGDARECFSFHHDLTRLILDDALHEYRQTRPDVENYEFANIFRTSNDLQSLRRQEFPDSQAVRYYLSLQEIVQKQRLLNLVAACKPIIQSESSNYLIECEVYRPVPINRDYTIPPREYKLHFEEWGQEQVRRGKYEQSLLFKQHFAPIAHHLAADIVKQSEKYVA